MISTITLATLANQGRMSLKDAISLYETAGSAAAVMEHRKEIRDIVPTASDSLCRLLESDLSQYTQRAEQEIEWCEKNKVRMLAISDAQYPERLRRCFDAPLVLFTRGKADLNASQMLNIVGTRKCTPYGQDFIASFVKEMAERCPEVVIVSGLAYGIDINAHRAALQHEISTVGVVAHGQDTLYPALHRNEANAMCLGNGAVVTEYLTTTRPEARNFLQRNRIIAGLCDATIVVESASHGGGLVTARIANDYNREVFAVPGPVRAEYSIGCNNLIRDSKARLISSADDLINAMQWHTAQQLSTARKAGIERTIFCDLTTEEQAIVNALKEYGDSQSNTLAIHTGLTIATLSSALFTLEMKGMVKALPGNTYHLIN